MSKLKSLFNPKSIAVVGVSNDPNKLGSVILSNLLHAKFKGAIYPINPKYDTVFGLKVYKSLSEIKKPIDVVVIVIPAPFVKDILLDAIKNGAKNAVIITAGFRETGKEGLQLEQEIIALAKKNNIRLLGPNCLGYISTGVDLNASFAASYPRAGSAAFISQSGAFATAMLDMSMEKNLGFSHFVTVGNKADIDENDIIDAWFEDDSVKVIGAYLEEMNYGRDLLELVQNAKNKKPIVVFKPGKSNEAQKAISSHTGSLAGSVETFKAAIKKAGIIEATEINNMYYLMMGFAWAPLPKGNRVAIVTNAGGPGIIATDLLVSYGMQMAEISAETKKAMASFMPTTASLSNPVDVIGDARADRFQVAIQELDKDPNVDSIMVIVTPQLVTQIEETAKLISTTAKITQKPIYPVFVGGSYVISGIKRMYDNYIPAFRYLEDAIKVMTAMYEYSNYLETHKKTDTKTSALIATYHKKGAFRTQVEAAYKKAKTGTVTLSEDTVALIAAEAGIPFPKQIVATTLGEGLTFAKKLYPVVLKAPNEVIAHKTDEKALYLNIDSDDSFTKAYTALETLIRDTFKKKPQILIQEMVKAKEELFIGANRDGEADVYDLKISRHKGFGHLLAFGKGGIYTEVYKDIAYALAPASRKEIETAFQSTKVFKIIDGARGQDKLAFSKIIDTIEAVQKMLIMYPEIISVDINPLLVTTKQAVCVDLKMFVG